MSDILSSKDDNILNILKWTAKEGTLLSSCEPEVKELMHQISILLTNNTTVHTQEINTLKQQLQSRDKELSSLRLAVHEKTLQADKLRSDYVQVKKELKMRSSDHETQLLRLRSELNRLNKCYEKLKNRKLKTASNGGVKKTDSSEDKTTFIEVLERRCEAYLEQIDDQKLSLEQLKNINDEITGKYLHSQKELVRLESELQRCQSKDGLEEELLAKDKKLALMKKERDMARTQTKDSLMESEKWYNQAMRLSVLNKESESRVSDIVKQLNELHQSVKRDEETRIKETIELKRQLTEKDNIIRELTRASTSTSGGNELLFNSLSLEDRKLKEENGQLKKRLEDKTMMAYVQKELKSELDKRETELHQYRIKIMKKDTELQSCQERISHLEELLSVAAEHANSHTSSLIERSPCHEKSTEERSPCHEKSTEKRSPHERSPNERSPNERSHHDTSSNNISETNTRSLLIGFEEKLSTIMNTHFTRIDQSLQNALVDK